MIPFFSESPYFTFSLLNLRDSCLFFFPIALVLGNLPFDCYDDFSGFVELSYCFADFFSGLSVLEAVLTCFVVDAYASLAYFTIFNIIT